MVIVAVDLVKYRERPDGSPGCLDFQVILTSFEVKELEAEEPRVYFVRSNFGADSDCDSFSMWREAATISHPRQRSCK